MPLSFLGKYTYSTIVYGQEAITLFLYFVALTFYKKKRPYYVLRLLLGFAFILLFSVVLALIRTEMGGIYSRITCSLLQQAAFIGLLLLCYDEHPAEIFLCFTGIVAAKGVSGKIFVLVLNLCGIDDLTSISFFGNASPLWYDWLIYWAIHAALLSLIYIFLRRREALMDQKSFPRAIALAIAAVLFQTIVGNFAREFQQNDFALGAISNVLIGIIYGFLLLLRSGLLMQSRTSHELEVTERLLREEKKHYEEMRSSIDAINMKCHDLKHHLSGIESKLTSAEIEELRQAIEVYDSSIHTGNEILDTILYQKMLESKQKEIPFKYLADVAYLDRLKEEDLYAMLANALNNAFEASLHLKKEERMVSLHIGNDGKTLTIEVGNAFDPASSASTQSNKTDAHYHGYGIRSMEYLAKRYRGQVRISRVANLFRLEILLPLSKEGA